MESMRRTILVAVALLAAPAALAQPKPSFDCAKASTPIEKLVCGSPELAKADSDLADTYTALAAKLDAKGREHLAKDETRWLVQRSRDCVGTAALMFDCVRDSYAERTARLKMYGDGPYPFISTQTLVKRGKVKAISYEAVANYPQFDDPSADFSVVNRRFADEVAKAVAQVVPGKDAGLDREQAWSYEQDFTLDRPVPTAITVQLSYSSFEGGAHPNGRTWAVLVDLSTGHAAGPDAVFVDGWLKQMVEFVRADLEKQFKEKPGFDDALEPANLAKLLRDPRRYSFGKEKLTVIFNSYDVGPYVVGPYEVKIPYSRLKPLLRSDGPLAALR